MVGVTVQVHVKNQKLFVCDDIAYQKAYDHEDRYKTAIVGLKSRSSTGHISQPLQGHYVCQVMLTILYITAQMVQKELLSQAHTMTANL